MSHFDVREMTESDVDRIVSYWSESDPDYLTSLGVDLDKLPEANDLRNILENQLVKSYQDKQAYAVIWLLNNEPIGHCNVNGIVFGDHAYMHLHIWKPANRLKGIGHKLVWESVPFFFENLKLRQLYCQPYALNEAPNRTLLKCGFRFVKKYTIVPGSINFEQEVNQWILTREDYLKITA